MSEDTKNLELLLGQLIGLYKLVNHERIKQEKDRFFEESDRRGKKGARAKVYSLCNGKNNVTEIAKKAGLNQPNASQNIAALLEAGLVRKEGSVYVKNF